MQKKRNSGGTVSDTKQQSYLLYKSGHSIRQIAADRKLKPYTVETHIVETIPVSEIDLYKIGLCEDSQKAITRAISEVGKSKLRPIKEKVRSGITYFQIRMLLKKKS